jgi:small subunit ribosomal protein S3
MGQKIHPIGFRLSVNKNWSSRWFANSKTFADLLLKDMCVHTLKRSRAMVSKIVIEVLKMQR